MKNILYFFQSEKAYKATLIGIILIPVFIACYFFIVKTILMHACKFKYENYYREMLIKDIKAEILKSGAGDVQK